MADRGELVRLRVAVARLAQSAGLDEHIPGGLETGAPFERLTAVAEKHERGWHTLVGRLIDKQTEVKVDWTRERANAAAVRFLGEGWRLLADGEILREGDETACVSLLLSIDYYEGWQPLAPEDMGTPINEWLKVDADAAERVFRRRKE